MNFVYKTNAFVIFLVSVSDCKSTDTGFCQIMLTAPIKPNYDTFRKAKWPMGILTYRLRK